jgi:hypothetical protein
MKVPHFEQAIIKTEKLTKYLLNFDHPKGKSKAKLFQILGFELSNADELASQLLNIIFENDFNEVEETQHGVSYIVFGNIVGDNGRTRLLKTIWMLPKDSDIPHFVTAYPF